MSTFPLLAAFRISSLLLFSSSPVMRDISRSSLFLRLSSISLARALLLVNIIRLEETKILCVQLKAEDYSLVAFEGQS